jgi:hypothetical protein
MDSEEQLLEEYKAEQLRNRGSEFTIKLKLHQVSAVIANIQLALRHPGNDGMTAEIGEELCRALISELENRGLPVSARVALMGFDPRMDV